MRRAAITGVALLLVGCLSSVGATVAWAATTRVALVIGNGAYADVPALPRPASDAAAVGQALRDVGFTQVTVATDLGHQALYDALRAFAKQSQGAEWSVLYYAGHGIEVEGKNYLVPVDAHLAADQDVDFEAVPMQTVLAAVGGARQLRLVILDACRDNPFAKRMARAHATRSIERGLSRVAPEGDLYLVYSAKSGQVAVDGKGGEPSPFVGALLKNIATPGLEINLLFRRVHADVKEASDGRQEPDFEGTLPADELYFKPGATAPAAPVEPARSVPAPAVAPAPAPSPMAAAIAPPIVVAPPTPAATIPRPALPPRVAPRSPAASASVEPPQVAARYAFVTGLDPNGDNFLALKAGPDIRSPRLMKMGPGTLLTIIGRSGPWAQVRLRSGETGWAFGRYVACCREE